MAVTAHPFLGTFDADRHSSVVFGIRHMQIATFRGWFGGVQARLVGDQTGVRLEGTAQVESISIGDPPEFRDHVVHSPEFLDSGKHPAIRFRSRSVDVGPDRAITVDGELTIRDVTRALVATGSYEGPVEDPFGSERAALELHATIDRRDWGITWQTPLPGGGDALGWAVQIAVQLELVKQR
jgi:polyisoprenoid-binding protein YceI